MIIGKSSLTTRVFADWQGESCKPLGRFYTLKLCPASTELIPMKPKIKRSKGPAKPEPEMSDEEKQLTVEKHISDALVGPERQLELGILGQWSLMCRSNDQISMVRTRTV